MEHMHLVDSNSSSKKRTVESDGTLTFEQKKQKTDDVEQLENVIQALREEVQAQNSKIQLLEKSLASLTDFNQQLNAGVDSPSPDASASTANLPTVILRQIFDNITDARTLVGCRAVCRAWKTMIDSTPALMRRLTFLILHPRFFLDLSNISPRVRSISFRQPLPSTEEDLQALVRSITPTLESVTFNLDMRLGLFDSRPDHHRHLASAILRQCPHLNELRILGKEKDFLQGLSFTEPAFSHITSLTIYAVNQSDHEGDFEKIILGLFRLATLNLFRKENDEEDDDGHDVEVSTSICAHILRYPGVLKKFTYMSGGDCGDYFWSGTLASKWTRLFLLAGRHGVVVVSNQSFNLDGLCRFKETVDAEVNLQTCSAIVNAELQAAAHQNADRVDLCVNVEHLKIHFEGPTETRETLRRLSILTRLKKLTELCLSGCSYSIGLQPDVVGHAHEILGQSVPSVQKLALEYDVFGCTDIFAYLPLYFPNLVDLRLMYCSIPANLFVLLQRCGWLATLELYYVRGLTDATFLPPQTNADGSPPIWNFTRLKQLTIRGGVGLTDNCLPSGILLMNTLEKLTVSDCTGLTEVGYAAITEGRLKMKRVNSFAYEFTLC